MLLYKSVWLIYNYKVYTNHRVKETQGENHKMNKNNLFPIGEASRLTNSSIQALRYYEKIDLLHPAYIDPDTNYRYYSADQLWIIDMIVLCVELSIPTKELKKFIGIDGIVDYSGLLAYGQEIAETKISQFQKGLKIMTDIQDKLAMPVIDKPLGEIYSQEFPTKYFYLIETKSLFSEISDTEIAKSAEEFNKYRSDYSNLLYSELILEYGFLYKNSQDSIERYLFIEVPEEIATQHPTKIMLMPQGNYFVVGHEQGTTRIEETTEIFKEQLQGVSDFIAIEINHYTSSHKEVNKPTELRVIGLK